MITNPTTGGSLGRPPALHQENAPWMSIRQGITNGGPNSDLRRTVVFSIVVVQIPVSPEYEIRYFLSENIVAKLSQNSFSTASNCRLGQGPIAEQKNERANKLVTQGFDDGIRGKARTRCHLYGCLLPNSTRPGVAIAIDCHKR